jgi:hypothetical protein
MIPQGILESAIKITNEAPTGLRKINLNHNYVIFLKECMQIFIKH